MRQRRGGRKGKEGKRSEGEQPRTGASDLGPSRNGCAEMGWDAILSGRAARKSGRPEAQLINDVNLGPMESNGLPILFFFFYFVRRNTTVYLFFLPILPFNSP